MLKMCMPFWREAHFEVKSVKNWPEHFWTFRCSFCVASARGSARCQKWAKREGFVAFSTTTTTTLHYITLHYTTLNYSRLHYTTLTTTTTASTTMLHYTSLHYTTLHLMTLQYTYTILHLQLQLQPQLHYSTIHYTTLQYITQTTATTTTTTT